MNLEFTQGVNSLQNLTHIYPQVVSSSLITVRIYWTTWYENLIVINIQVNVGANVHSQFEFCFQVSQSVLLVFKFSCSSLTSWLISSVKNACKALNESKYQTAHAYLHNLATFTDKKTHANSNNCVCSNNNINLFSVFYEVNVDKFAQNVARYRQ